MAFIRGEELTKHDLNPCPFCTCENIQRMVIDKGETKTFMFQCYDCKARVLTSVSIEHAVELWNDPERKAKAAEFRTPR